MIMRILRTGHLARRVRRSAREIALAVILTLAAIVFVIAAVRGGTPETAAVVDPGTKPISKAN